MNNQKQVLDVQVSRGRSVSETGARHRTTEEYRSMLSEECTTIEGNISRHQKVLSELQSDIRLAERRVKEANKHTKVELFFSEMTKTVE